MRKFAEWRLMANPPHYLAFVDKIIRPIISLHFRLKPNTAHSPVKVVSREFPNRLPTRIVFFARAMMSATPV